MNDKPSEHRYDFSVVETRWQENWEREQTFATAGPGEGGFDAEKPKYYVLDMFPYPSGVGLHVGHPLGYIATDIMARYKRMRGFNVLHPMGFDAFGLPAEQFAIDHGVHPRVTTEKNIATMMRQLKRLGLSYDWNRKVATTDVAYYRWTQWIFLQLYNSYFDPLEEAARPIGQLIEQLENGRLLVNFAGRLVPERAEGLDGLEGEPIGTRKWISLSEEEQRNVIDSHRLAYLDEVAVNWCPELGTVLANEEVTNEGRSERGNYPVYKRPLKQWMLRITAYAQRLSDELEGVDWPESIKIMQRNWIGRSEGAMVDFAVDGSDEMVRVFTTRPDTLFGATYMVLAPEHELVDLITTKEQREAVIGYQREAESRSDVDRQDASREKTGVFTGSYAINPVNDERIPIWIADYVLTGYGTGAIMAVPAHDDRDFAFAKKFGLAVRAVVSPDDGWLMEQAKRMSEEPGGSGPCHVGEIAQLRARYMEGPASFPEAFTGDGANVNSANDEVSLDGLDTPEAKRMIAQWLGRKNLGHGEVQYKLRDWLFSRQRYWGEPFPILHDEEGRVVALDEADLPVQLPEMDDFRPQSSDDPDAPPQPPLSRADESWRVVTRGARVFQRELNTMPQWAGSCWYYLRYLDPLNDRAFCDAEKQAYWMGERGVDLYVGGAEHAVLHLLYARFWHKVLFDLGHVTTREPFGKLYNQGYIQAFSYQDARGIYVDAQRIEEKDGKFFFEGQPVTRSLGKMGKSLKNAVSPDEICEEYGCDTLRLYEMYLGPLDASKPWNTRDIVGVHRFLQRVWRNFVDEETGDLRVTPAAASGEQMHLLHKTIKRVSADMERMSYNTAIAALIELNNALVGSDRIPRAVAEAFVLMLSPMAPHICEELWQRLGYTPTLAQAPWPICLEEYLVEDEVEIVVQVLGKVRARVKTAAGLDEKALEEAVLADEKVQQILEGKKVRKVIVVPGRLVNIVAN